LIRNPVESELKVDIFKEDIITKNYSLNKNLYDYNNEVSSLYEVVNLKDFATFNRGSSITKKKADFEWRYTCCWRRATAILLS
jgi:hypothetical protein